MLVYKYRSLNAESFENTLSIFESGSIYFSSYEQLNDPFEYSYRWSVESPLQAKVDFWTALNDHYRVALTGKSKEQQEKDITQWEQTISAPKGPSILGMKDVGVFCISTARDIIPMWSLYADSHRGMCLEFDTKADDILSKARPVNYTDDPAEFSLYRGYNAARDW